jgi:hypothetical protein
MSVALAVVPAGNRVLRHFAYTSNHTKFVLH